MARKQKPADPGAADPGAVDLVVVAAFSGPEGRFAIGDTLTAPRERADHLTDVLLVTTRA